MNVYVDPHRHLWVPCGTSTAVDTTVLWTSSYSTYFCAVCGLVAPVIPIIAAQELLPNG